MLVARGESHTMTLRTYFLPYLTITLSMHMGDELSVPTKQKIKTLSLINPTRKSELFYEVLLVKT